MRLEKILDKLGSFEKNSFIKIIDQIILKNSKNKQEIEEILMPSGRFLYLHGPVNHTVICDIGLGRLCGAGRVK